MSPADWQQEVESFEHISLPAPTIDVDTTNGYDPPLAEIVEFVNRVDSLR